VGAVVTATRTTTSTRSRRGLALLVGAEIYGNQTVVEAEGRSLSTSRAAESFLVAGAELETGTTSLLSGASNS
jgi:hypothetical protein